VTPRASDQDKEEKKPESKCGNQQEQLPTKSRTAKMVQKPQKIPHQGGWSEEVTQ